MSLKLTLTNKYVTEPHIYIQIGRHTWLIGYFVSFKGKRLFFRYHKLRQIP